MAPRAGTHYPAHTQQFHSWFSTDDDCRSYLEWLRWSNHFHCPMCGVESCGWQRSDGRRHCKNCNSIVSVTAGTVFDKTRLPLTVWFQAAWYMTQQTNGVTATGLKKELGISSAQTAWHMLHRYRSSMVRTTRPKLSGRVEVDETVVGGPKPGVRGRGAKGKVKVAVAVELIEPKGFGRCRLGVIPDYSAKTLHHFICDNVEEGSVVITDELASYNGIEYLGYEHWAYNVKQSGKRSTELMPAVNQVCGNLKRWLTGTLWGAVTAAHMQSYLEEFTFRWNRKRSQRRGMLFYRLMECAVSAPPLRYDDLAKIRRPKPKGKKPSLPATRFLGRRELVIADGRPWLTAPL